MRDLLVTLIFALVAIAALRRPYYGALLWVWIGLMNPHRIGWGFAYSMPFAMAAGVVTLLGMIFVAKDVRWLKNSALNVLAALIVWMGVTTLFAVHFEPSLEKYIDVLKVLGMVFLVGSLVRTREEILGLVWVVVLSIGFFGFKGGIFTLATGGAHIVWGPPASVVLGNNELAVALIICIPLFYFLIQQVAVARQVPLLGRIPEKWLTRGLYLTILLCAVSAVGTQSRGALLAIASMGVALWWRSRSKLALGFGILLLAPALLMFMPEEWFARMDTIKTYQEDASAMGRINAWTMAFNIANDRFFGAGFATATPFMYAMYAPDPSYVLVAHSIYFQMLGEHGYVGLALYLLFWFLTYRTAGRLMRVGKEHPELDWIGQLGAMSKVSLVGFAVGGAFLSLAYWDMPFYITVALAAADNFAKNQLAEKPPQSAAAFTGVAHNRFESAVR